MADLSLAMACPARMAATSTNDVLPPAAMHSSELAETGSMTMRSTSFPSSDFSKQWARPWGKVVLGFLDEVEVVVVEVEVVVGCKKKGEGKRMKESKKAWWD